MSSGNWLAFPRAAFAPAGVTYEDIGTHDSQEGMTYRQWLAGQALTGILAGIPFDEGYTNSAVCQQVGKAAVAAADAVLAALAHEQGGEE